jgi:hypothetical protein
MSSLDFTTAVIDLAIRHGFHWKIDVKLYRSDLNALANDALDNEEILNIREAIDDLYYDSLDYLNEVSPDEYLFDVEESSLFLVRTDDCERMTF